MEYETTQPQVENLAPPQAEVQVESTATPAEPTTEQQPSFELEVKYNKESKKLTREEAIEYAQKGMNYDKVLTAKQEHEQRLKELEELELFAKELAEESGTSLSEVGKRLRKQRTDAKNAKADADRAAKLNITPEAARLLREAEERAGQAESQVKTYQSKVTEYEQAQADQTAANQEVETFKTAHPDVDTATLAKDPEFMNLWQPGIPLESAYQFYAQKKEFERMKTEMTEQAKVQETNQANSEASTGALGAGGTVEKPLTQDDINNMTPEQLDKNHEKIWAYLTGQKK